MQIFTHKISLCSSLLFGADPAAPMNIKVLTWQKILSKLLKNLHIRTSYTFLSVSRIFRHEWIVTAIFKKWKSDRACNTRQKNCISTAQNTPDRQLWSHFLNSLQVLHHSTLLYYGVCCIANYWQHVRTGQGGILYSW